MKWISIFAFLIPGIAFAQSMVPGGAFSNQPPSYSATSERVATATAATDVWCITGSATKIVKVQGVRISGTASANTLVPVSVTKRSSANSGGTSSAVTIVPHDSQDPASTASVLSYTANPSLGTTVGDIRGESLIFAGNSAPNLIISPEVFQFSVYNGKVPILRGTGELFCVNLNGTTISGGQITVDAQWTEE